ncbi:MAG: response regulator [Vicinamibacteria bacterium]
MALNGRIEDMNLLEILQIVAFSKKTGTLEVESPRANGSILFREGRLLCAFSSATERVVSALAKAPLEGERQSLLFDQIRLALRELIALREGHFEFRLCASLPVLWGGMDASSFLAGEGIDTQETLLELARELDEARRDSTRLLEDSDPPLIENDDEGGHEPRVEAGEPSLSGTGVTVLLADDEPLVLQIVGQELDDAGFVVESAGAAVEALAILNRRERSETVLVLAIDAGMPTSSADAFDGGFEILEDPRTRDASAPVLLMAESLSPEARARARRLGVKKFALKPTLTKLDPEEYGADLRAFARTLVPEIVELVRLAGGTSPVWVDQPGSSHDVTFDFLKTMTDQLSARGNGITRMILRVASKYSERAVLFLVKDGTASGLAGVHHGKRTPEVVERVRGIEFELQHVQPFAEVVYSRRPVRLTEGSDPSLDALERGRARELALFPLLHNHEVLAVLGCDNPNTGAPLSKLTGLQLFLVQAGMALENASLHRRLQTVERRYSLQDQGPLTEELTPIAREGP